MGMEGEGTTEDCSNSASDDESEEEIDDSSAYSSSNPRSPPSPSNHDSDSDSDSDNLIAPRSQQSPTSLSSQQSPIGTQKNHSGAKKEENGLPLPVSLFEKSDKRTADQTKMSPRKSPIYKNFALQAHIPISKRYEDRHHLINSSKYYKPHLSPVKSHNIQPPSPKAAKYLSIPSYRHKSFDHSTYNSDLMSGKSYPERHYLYEKNMDDTKRLDYEREYAHGFSKYRDSVAHSSVPSMTQIMPPVLYSPRDIKPEPLPPIHTIPLLQRHYSDPAPRDVPPPPYHTQMPRFPRSPTEVECRHPAYNESSCPEDCGCQNALQRFARERRLKDMISGVENHARTSTYDSRALDLHSYKRYTDELRSLESSLPCRKECCHPREGERIQGKRHHREDTSPTSPGRRGYHTRDEFARNTFTYSPNSYRYDNMLDEKPEKSQLDVSSRWKRVYSDTDPERVKVIVGEPATFYRQNSRTSSVGEERMDDSKNISLKSVTHPATGLHYLTVPQVLPNDVGYMSNTSIITIETGKIKTPSSKQYSEPNGIKSEEFRSPKKTRHDSVSPKPSIQVSTVDSSTSSSRDSVAECSGLMGLTKVANEHLGQAIAKERKRGKTKGINNNCLHLWEFLRDMLNHQEEVQMKAIEWTNKDLGEFRLIKTALIAQLWGKSKNRKSMTYEKMARAMRYYYKMGILEKVPHKRLHFRFGGKMLTKVFSEPTAQKHKLKLQLDEGLAELEPESNPEELKVNLPPLFTNKKFAFEDKLGLPETHKSAQFAPKAYTIPISPMNSAASVSTPETPLEYNSDIEDVSDADSCDTDEEIVVDIPNDRKNEKIFEGMTELTKFANDELSRSPVRIRQCKTPLPDLIPISSERPYCYLGNEGKVVA